MSVSVGGGKGGDRRKPVGAELNLVPYIDLLTCMIAFLLITAVWTQLASVKAHQRGQGEAGTEGAPPETKIVVIVREDGFSLVVDADQQPLPKTGEELDYDRLGKELKALKQTHPDKTDVQVASEDVIKFDTLIQTMDQVMAAGFPEVSLLDSGSGAL